MPIGDTSTYLPDKDYLLTVLSTINPGHEFFAKDYKPPPRVKLDLKSAKKASYNAHNKPLCVQRRQQVASDAVILDPEESKSEEVEPDRRQPAAAAPDIQTYFTSSFLYPYKTFDFMNHYNKHG